MDLYINGKFSRLQSFSIIVKKRVIDESLQNWRNDINTCNLKQYKNFGYELYIDIYVFIVLSYVKCSLAFLYILWNQYTLYNQLFDSID